MIDVFNNIAALASYIHTTTRNNGSVITNKVISDNRRPLYNNGFHRIVNTPEDIDTWNQIKEYNR